jgi:hypothetical protein
VNKLRSMRWEEKLRSKGEIKGKKNVNILFGKY